MNSSEQKEYQHNIPTTTEIADTLDLVRNKLALPEIWTEPNEDIREGYTEVLRILSERVEVFEEIDQSLASEEAKKLAVWAVKYLRGEGITLERLLSVAVKRP
ncbi:MAG: hypothetical protein BGO21_30905 [Dyadobacter sp. 50-39]|uniref:hypothetical protein n=1 Tax=Dyadobacter sp. 50-39 TaxID=1895756 RepID=UPI000958ED33|nr:hypothetical protein [Dyadobacter sp. 50-39]OJV15406.1 MAG: hypothetical protein BGO21_30905 [Dyadobacter sp. 50-39]